MIFQSIPGCIGLLQVQSIDGGIARICLETDIEVDCNMLDFRKVAPWDEHLGRRLPKQME